MYYKYENESTSLCLQITYFRWAEKIMQRQGSTLWGLIETDSSFNVTIRYRLIKRFNKYDCLLSRLNSKASQKVVLKYVHLANYSA